MNILNTVLSENIIHLVHENELDGIVGNEVTDATPNGGLVRSGAGTAVSPYTLGIAAGGVTASHIADNAVNSSKISDNSVTSSKIVDGTITNVDISSSAAIDLTKPVLLWLRLFYLYSFVKLLSRCRLRFRHCPSSDC